MSFYRATVATILLGLVLGELLRRRTKASRPPGPPGYPIVGNLFDAPKSLAWLTYERWSREYGDFMSFSILGTTIAVVTSYSKGLELENKGSIYSSRPYLAMTGELMGYDQALGLIPYGARMKSVRRLFSRELGSRARVQDFHTQLEEQGKVFIKAVHKNPNKVVDHIYIHAGAVILRITYGYPLIARDDHIISLMNEAMDVFSESLAPGRFLCNQFPILRYIPWWIPGAGFQKLAVTWKQVYTEAVEFPFKWTQSQMIAGKAESSFVSKRLLAGASDPTLHTQEADELMHAAGGMYTAGTETTAVTMHAFIITMAQYPDVQSRLRHEVRSVTGDRMPTLQDTEKMPYLNAVTKEVMRLYPSAPMSLPHATLEDDVHDGYFIPKGTMVLFNLWLMLRDPSVFKHPEQFNPDRFIGEHPETDPRAIVFGFGRRACPGRFLAEASLQITAAMLIYSFDFNPAEVNGKPVPLECRPSNGGVVNHLEPVDLQITPHHGVQVVNSPNPEA